MGKSRETGGSPEQGKTFGAQMRERLNKVKQEASEKRTDKYEQELEEFNQELLELLPSLKSRLEKRANLGIATLVQSFQFAIYGQEDIKALPGYKSLVELCKELDVSCNLYIDTSAKNANSGKAYISIVIGVNKEYQN